MLGPLGCDTAPQVSPAEPLPQPAAPEVRWAVPPAEPVRLTVVPPPPGADTGGWAPLSEAELDRARRPLDQVLADALPGPKPPAPETAEPQLQPPLAAQKFYAQGRYALREGDHFKSVQAFEKALRLSPRSPEILRALGHAWARAGNRVSAADHLRRTVAIDPDDFESLFMLGRFAADDRRWDEAIASFAGALRLTAADPPPRTAADPALKPLLSFFLARVLAESGAIEAAQQALADYFEAPRPERPGSARGRELALIDSQRGESLALRGDLAHRLNDPEAALRFYAAAEAAGVMNGGALRRRQLYTRLRLGQRRAAGDLALDAVVEAHGDTSGLALLGYAIEHGVPAAELSSRLHELYAQEGRPAALALALADVLPADDAAALLDEHLDQHPDAEAVLRRRLALALGPVEGPAAGDGLDRAVALTLAGVRRSPDRAAALVRPLLALTAGDPAALVRALGTWSDAAAAYLRGRALVAAERGDEARAAYEQSIDLPDAPPAAREALAALLVSAREYDAATAVLEPLIGQQRPRTDRLRVRVLTDGGRGDEALMLIDELLRGTTDTVFLLRQKSRLLTVRGDAAGAERALLDALNTAPTHEPLYRDLIALYNANPEMTRNLQRLWRRMIDTIPQARVTREQLVGLHLASGDHAAAQRLLGPLLAETPNNVGLLAAAAELYAKTGRTADLDTLVARHLERSAELNQPPAGEVIRPALGQAQRAGDLDRVLELSDRFWTPQPPGSRRSLELARVRFTQERFGEAAWLAAQGIEADFDPPLNNEQHAVLASILIRSTLLEKRFDQAEAAAGQAMDRLPEHALLLGRGLALGYDELERHADAERVREQLLARFPDDPTLCNALGYAWANRGERLDEAAVLVQRALDAEPDTAAFLDSLGWVRYKQGRFEEAIVLLERGRAQPGGDHAVIIDHIGDAYYRLEREGDAVRAWNQAALRVHAAAQDPDDPANNDPELKGLDGRLAAKLGAVSKGRGAPVAALGQGVVPAPPAAEAVPGAAPNPAPPADSTAGAARVAPAPGGVAEPVADEEGAPLGDLSPLPDSSP